MFRFTIRDVLWSMVVVGLAISLYAQCERASRWQARAEYVRRMQREQFGLESNWDGYDAGFDWVEGHHMLEYAREKQADMAKIKELQPLKTPPAAMP